jgi:hypothetical protein
MKFIAGVCAAGLLIASSTLGAQQTTAPEPLPPCRPGATGVQQHPETMVFGVACFGQMPAPDVLTSAHRYFRGAAIESPWRNYRARLYEGIVAGQKPQILVPPFQVQGYAIDRAERLLMAGRLAQRIAGRDATVADPFLTGIALGEGLRRYDPERLTALMHLAGASSSVLGYVGHDRGHRMYLTIEVLKADGSSTKFDWKALAFSDTDQPSEVFNRMLPEIMKTIGLADNGAKPVPPGILNPAIPASPKAAIGVKPGGLDAALSLQIFAMLAPAWPEPIREELFERSLLVLDGVEPLGEDYEILRARALLHLNKRPAVLRFLSNPISPDAIAVSAFADGNLPALEKAVAESKRPALQLVARLEAMEMRAEYEGGSGKAAGDAVSGAALQSLPGWAPLVQRAIEGHESWTISPNADLKQALETWYPVANLSTEDLARRRAITGANMNDISAEMQLAVFRHAERLVKDKPARWSRQRSGYDITDFDLVRLIDAQAEKTVVREAYRAVILQAAYENGLAAIDAYESVYKGHPYFAVLRGVALANLAGRRTGAQRETTQRAASEAFMQALDWSQGNNRAAGIALSQAGNIKNQRQAAGEGATSPLDAYTVSYIGEFPLAPYWSPWESGGNADLINRNRRQQLLYSISDLSALWSLVDNARDAEERKMLRREAESRFIGARTRTQILAKLPVGGPDDKGENAVYEAEIAKGSNDWSVYEKLGGFMIASGDYKGADAVLSRYPAFNDMGKANAVQISNAAELAGSMFFWRGHLEEAKRYYTISAGLDTGSYGSLTAAMRLALLERDYQSVVQYSYQRATRYNNANGYRDLFSWLHVLGNSKDAWLGFDQLAGTFKTPLIWPSALVGHRLEGKTQEQIRTWLLQPAIRQAGEGEFRFSSAYAFMSHVVDRKPTRDLTTVLQTLETPSRYFVSGGRVVMGDKVLHPDGGGLPGIGPEFGMSAILKDKKPGEDVKSDLVYAAEGMVALRAGDFAAAYGQFAELRQVYVARIPRLSWIMPYYAYAGVRAGKEAELVSVLHVIPEKDWSSHYFLAMAMVDGMKGRHTEALAGMRKAFDKMPRTEERPVFTEYQQAEAAEWLYESTKHEPYRDAALEWARLNQQIQPMYAWAYAMEAKLAKEPDARVRALAIALYLDRGSERIAAFSDQEKAVARKWFEKNNPFVIPQAPKSKV